MPAATTHVEFAKEVYRKLDIQTKNKITNIQAFYLGAQGPDLFFFSKAGILPGSLKKLGSMMHEEKPYEAIQYMYHHLDNDNDLISYYFGFICHYCLDCQAHPLIFYSSRYLGNKLEDEMVNHFRIEAMIDAYILNNNNRSIGTFDTDQAVKVQDVDTVKIASMYVGLFKEVYGVDADFLRIQKACKECSRYLRLLRPSSYNKFRVLSTIESLVHQEHFVSSLMLFNDFKNKDEILNNNHHEYFNIFDENIKYTTSFMDCYNIAVTKAIQLIHNPNNKEDFKLDFDGRVLNS